MESTGLLFNARQRIDPNLALISTRYSTHLGGGNELDSRPVLIQAPLAQKLCYILLLHLQDEVSSHRWGRLYKERKVVVWLLRNFPREMSSSRRKGFLRGICGHSSIPCPGWVSYIYHESMIYYCLDHCVVICTWINEHKMLFSSSSVAFLHSLYTMVNDYTHCKAVKVRFERCYFLPVLCHFSAEHKYKNVASCLQ